MAEKRFYWLKLPEDFFRRSYIRRLRQMEEGDRLVLIYLEALLSSLKNGGSLPADDGDPAENLALELYEDPAETETLLKYLLERGKLTTEKEGEYHLTDSDELTGSETDDARRMRESRQRKKAAAAAAESGAAAGMPTFTDEDFALRMAALRSKL